MSISNIFNEARSLRFRCARDNSKEPIIRKASATILEAEAIVSSIFADLGLTFDGEVEQMPIEPTNAIPLVVSEPVEIILKPKAGSSKNPPEHDEDMAKWDTLDEEVQSKIFDLRSRLRILH